MKRLDKRLKAGRLMPGMLMPGMLMPGMLVLLLVACTSTAPATPSPTPPLATATPIVTPVATATEAPSTAVTPEPLPLSEAGPYFPGKRSYAWSDASRGDRSVEVIVWYPALKPADFTGTIARDADFDLSGAPYPLIITSAKVGHIFAPYLVSHGFVMVGVDRIDSYPKMNEQMLDQPLDLLFMLNHLVTDPPQELVGLIDAEHTGAMGYSFDGYNTLAMSGARIDPAYYLAQCPIPDATTQAIVGKLSAFDCGPAADWNAFAAHAGPTYTTSDDGLWQPLTDPRIRAVIPLACEGWWLFGERGLAAVDRPTLMLDGTADELYAENALIFEHLGVADKRFISFVSQDHMMIFDGEWVARMAHFVTAFFGVHLQGRQEWAQYFSESFVNNTPDLKAGVVTAP